MRFEVIEVQGYSGYKSNEKPLSFRFRNREHRILEIIDRWYEGSTHSSMPSLDYYKIKTDDGTIHIIRYNRLFDKWSLVIPDNIPQ